MKLQKSNWVMVMMVLAISLLAGALPRELEAQQAASAQQPAPAQSAGAALFYRLFQGCATCSAGCGASRWLLKKSSGSVMGLKVAPVLNAPYET